MDRQLISALAARATGALLGGLSGLQLASHFGMGNVFAAISGAILGGIIAYVTIDFAQFRACTASAWRDVTSWQPDTLFWKFFAQVCLAKAGWMLLVTGYLISALWIKLGAPQHLLLIPLRFIPALLGCVLIGSLFVTSMEASDCRIDKSKKRTYVTMRKEVRSSLKMLWYSSPPGIAVALTRGVWFVLRTSPKWLPAIGLGLEASGRFLALVFVAVHSQRRVSCFVDAAIGTFAGLFWFNSPFIGALVGVAMGVLAHAAVQWKITVSEA